MKPVGSFGFFDTMPTYFETKYKENSYAHDDIYVVHVLFSIKQTCVTWHAQIVFSGKV